MVEMKFKRRVEAYVVDKVQRRLEKAVELKPRQFNSKPLRDPGGQDRHLLKASSQTHARPRAELEKIAAEGSMGEIVETLENCHIEKAGGYREAAVVGLPEDIQNNLAGRLYRKRRLQRSLIKAVSYAVPVALISALAIAGVNSGAIALAVLFSVIFRYVAPRLMKDIGIRNGQIAGLLKSDNKLAEGARETIARLSREESSAWEPGSRTRILMKSANRDEFPRFDTWEDPPGDGWFAWDKANREQQAEAECQEADEQKTRRTR